MSKRLTESRLQELVSQIQHQQCNPAELTTKELEKIIVFARDRYTNTSSPVLDDSTYDALENILLAKDPHNKILNKVGSSVKKDSTTLPYWMGSLDKLYATDESKLQRWMQKFHGEYIISTKLDGVSAILHYHQNQWNLYSRGDGKKGSIWTENLQYLVNLHPILESFPPQQDDIIIRGELILSKEHFAQFADLYVTPLAMVNGLLGSKTKKTELIAYVQFKAYELIRPSSPIPTVFHQWQQLQTFGFSLPPLVTTTSTLTFEFLSELLLQWKSQCEFNIDGIVIINNILPQRYQSGNPEYAFAFKQNQEMVQATVVGIEWNISKDGYLKPIVKIQPISINGFTISNVTGYNAKFIQDHQIGVNSVVNISRCGDVIPNIISVVSSTQALMPEIPYTWNNTKVDVIASNVTELPQYLVKNILHLSRALNISSVSEGRIDNIVRTKQLTSVIQFLTLQQSDLQDISGFGSKLITTLLTEIQNGIQKATLLQWIVGSNMFGRGFSDKKLTTILQYCPMILTLTSDQEIMTNLLQVEGIQQTTAEHALLGIQRFQSFYLELQQAQINVPSLIYTSVQLLYTGKEIVLTGFRDQELQNQFEQQGGCVGNQITHKTIALIVKEHGYENQKTNKAKSSNIPIFTRQEWINNQLTI